jgi:hypothetical protein
MGKGKTFSIGTSNAEILFATFSSHLTALCDTACYDYHLSNASEILIISDGHQELQVPKIKI